MKKLLFSVSVCVVTGLGAAEPAAAHELWLEPLEPRIDSGAILRADIRVGSGLDGPAYAYQPERVRQFVLVTDDTVRPVHPERGALPALRREMPDAGLVRLAYLSHPSQLVYDDLADLEQFGAEEGLTGLMMRHAARGLPDTGFKELFSRSAKALIAVGGGAGQDTPLGLPFEIVLEDNPYTSPPGEQITAQLLWQGRPAADIQVSIFRRDDEEEVTVERMLTDADGRVSFTPASGFYLLNAVRMEVPSAALAARTGAVWHSLWASTTFHYGIQ